MLKENYIESLKKQLKENIGEKRYLHSVRVMETCVNIVKMTNIDVDINKVMVAGLLHDCARDIENDKLQKMFIQKNKQISKIEIKQPSILHSKVGSILAYEKYGIRDVDVLEAISCHTTGKENMSLIDKILFVADFIEPDRNFKDIDVIREMVYNDMDSAVKYILKSKIIHTVKKGDILHVDTVNSLNWIILDEK